MPIMDIPDTESWENRRQYSRIRAELAMQYRVLREGVSTPPAWNSSQTKNISASGISFETFHPLGLNTLLEVNLNVPFFKDPVPLKARVVRVMEIKLGEVYGIAAAIVDIKPSDRKKLQMELEQIDISSLLTQAVEKGATDVHLSLGHPPMMRIAGKLIAMEYEALGKKALKRMIYSLLNEEQIAEFEKNNELNAAVSIVTVEGSNRFRVNVHMQQSSIEAGFHLIVMPIPGLDDLRLPKIVSGFAGLKSGLVFITGLSGSGKSTTAAALLNKINYERACVIMTFLRPIEYVFPVRKSIIKQREVGVDTESFAEGLLQSIRQDPDVILVSDIPDARTMELVIEASMSGKLVFVTVSSSGIIDLLNKVVNIFSSEKQYYVRKILSKCLKAIVFQRLLPMKDSEERRIAAAEVMLNTPVIAEVICEGLLDKITAIMKNDPRSGMLTMEKSLKELWDNGMISSETVDAYSSP